MTQLTASAAPRRSDAHPDGGQLARLTQRLRIAGRRVDVVDLGVTLWLTMWAACVSASLFLLAR